VILGIAAVGLSVWGKFFLAAAGLGIAALFVGLVARRRALRSPDLTGEAIAACSVALGAAAVAIGSISWAIEHDIVSGGGADPPAVSKKVAPPSTSQGKTVDMGQVLRFPSQWSVSVTKARRSPELTPRYEFAEQVKPRGVFVILSLAVINETNVEAPFDESLIDLVDRDGTVYTASARAGDYQLGNLAGALEEASLEPDKLRRGRLAFDVPRGARIDKARVVDTLDVFEAEGPPDSFISLRVSK
jgi:uncharacterized protein DUF4352